MSEKSEQITTEVTLEMAESNGAQKVIELTDQNTRTLSDYIQYLKDNSYSKKNRS